MRSFSIYKNIVSVILIISYLALVGLATAQELPGPAAGTNARAEKLRILVDKVMQEHEGWVTKEWMVKEAAEAGFNVYSPRRGFDKLDEVNQDAKWCQKYDIAYMPWMRGTRVASMNSEADGKRYVPADGQEQPLYSPNSDELWEWMSHYILAYAKLSVKNKSLMGVFLDFENYVPKVKGQVKGHCYELSYDDGIFYKFAKDKKIKVPALPLDKRDAWLEAQ